MNTKLRLFSTVVLIVAGHSLLFAAGKGEKHTGPSDGAVPLTINCGVPTAPPALPLLRMIETNAMGEDVNLDYTLWSSPEQLIAMLQGSEGDMFALPLTVAAKLYNKGMPFKISNVNTWGVTYFTTTDPEFSSWTDLKGETVYIPLRSSPPIS